MIARRAAPPKVYFAGKITKLCWRHGLVPALRDHHWALGPIRLAGFTYVGPFFVACDHGCFHRPASHGALSEGADCSPDHGAERRAVIERCTSAVDDCDILFAYIDELECYGTVAEIERALIGKKYVVIAFAPGIVVPGANEFWFVAERAHRVELNVRPEELQQLLTRVLRDWQ